MSEINLKVPLDELEAELLKHPAADCPVVHRFAPGMYIREITIPAGVMLTSAIHKTEHPFVLSQGVAYVTTEDGSREILTAPHTGITLPGTRRAIFAESEVIWTTFHATEETEVEKICLAILEPHNNLLIADKSETDQWRKSLPSKKPCLS